MYGSRGAGVQGRWGMRAIGVAFKDRLLEHGDAAQKEFPIDPAPHLPARVNIYHVCAPEAENMSASAFQSCRPLTERTSRTNSIPLLLLRHNHRLFNTFCCFLN